MRFVSLACGRYSLTAISLLVLLAACNESDKATAPAEKNFTANTPLYTAGFEIDGALLGRASSDDGFKLKRKNGSWEFDLNAKDPTDLAVQSLTFQPGGHSGWHSHPGPVLLQVTSGTLTFYEAGDKSCTPHVVTTGQLFICTALSDDVAGGIDGSDIIKIWNSRAQARVHWCPTTGACVEGQRTLTTQKASS